MKPDPLFGKKTTDQIWEARAAATEKLGRATIEAIIQAAYERQCELDAGDPFAAIKAPPKPKRVPVPRKRNEFIDALAAACGGVPELMTQTAIRTVGVAFAEIKQVCPDVTVDDIQRAAQKYKEAHRDWPLTAPALSKRWHEVHLPGHRTASAARDVYLVPLNWERRAKALYPEADFGGREWLSLPITIRSQILKQTQ